MASEEKGIQQAPSGELASRKTPPRFPMWLKLLAVVAVVFLATMGVFRSSSQNEQVVQDSQGSSDVPDQKYRKPAPALTFKDKAGKTLSIGDFKGKVVLLSFWASWCTPCIVELPSFIDIYNKFHAKGLEIIPVNVDEPGEESAGMIDEFWKTKKFPFMSYFDRDKTAAEAMKVENLPTNLLIDRQGRIVAQSTGSNDWSSEQAVEFIDQLLSEQSSTSSGK